MVHYLIVGTLLGLSAGLAPGPLLTLVISETLRHDMKAGIRVALAPMITDLPIILFTLLVLARLSDFHQILGIISLVGGCLLLYMGGKGLMTKGVSLEPMPVKSNSMTKGILVNALSPHPYLFWFSIGGPTGTRALEHGIPAVLAFFISFYFLLVGSKIVLAVITGQSKSFLKGNIYIYLMRFLGLALCILALFLFQDGFRLLGWITSGRIT